MGIYGIVVFISVDELNSRAVFITLAQCLLQLFIRVKKKNK